MMNYPSLKARRVVAVLSLLPLSLFGGELNLFSKAGLPAVPIRTNDFPMPPLKAKKKK